MVNSSSTAPSALNGFRTSDRKRPIGESPELGFRRERVVGGLVNAPVLAVPTSVGYGASFGGVAALLGMLNTCSPNVSVVNIDNGFGAACIASLINRL